MSQINNVNIIQEETDLKKIYEIFVRNKKIFIVSIIIAIGFAFLINRYTIPIYSVSASILIKEEDQDQGGADVNDFLNSSLLGRNINFQNELWVLKSSPVIEEVIHNLDLRIAYLSKGRIKTLNAYKEAPFRVSLLPDHAQPLNVRFTILPLNEDSLQIEAESKYVAFFNYNRNEFTHRKVNWTFQHKGRFGELIETSDLAFIVQQPIGINQEHIMSSNPYQFEFKSIDGLRNQISSQLSFDVTDRTSTVIEIIMRSPSVKLGIDNINELMNVYSKQNLERKNHIASITIDYIEKQLSDISDSLSRVEDNLQIFRASNQLLDIGDQATNISNQYMDLENQLAELVSKKRYYDYVMDMLSNDNFSNIILPASIGVSDQLLTNLMTELISAQAKRSNLIENRQERNPMVQTLEIQIDNLKKTIAENIAAVNKTNAISIEEMTKRIKNIQTEISRLPATQRKLGTIERKYRLNDAIYNYLMEKHAEAKITQASNLPDNIIIEPAKMKGMGPISPNKRLNYMFAFLMGLALPFGYLLLKSKLNNKIESQDDLESLSGKPVLGKIMHNRYKTKNVMFEFPKSNIAESFRALRTNLDFYARGSQKKVILVSSCLENEGKSFVAMNLAMSYAQLGRRTILVDFDLRKPKTYFTEKVESMEGLSSFMIDKVQLGNIINKSPHDKLDYIFAGVLPPNPVELIALEKTELLINTLKDYYDIILLDTPPLAQVIDAYLLIAHSDIKVIITRCNQTLKKVFSIIMKDLNQKKISNVCIVLNDNKMYRDQYGYGYGYYNKGSKSKKWKKQNHRIKVPELVTS